MFVHPTLAALVFSGGDWLLPVAFLFCFGLILIGWGYRKSPMAQGPRRVAAVLKTLGLASLALCLLEPLWTSTRARPGANYFAVVADNSQGMQVRDRGQSKMRSEQLHGLLTAPESEWQLELNEEFQVRKYVFDSRLQGTKDFAELTFDGRASALAGAIQNLAERYRGRPLAGILVFTDGNATDVLSGLPDLTGIPPVYPVVVGEGQPEKDVALQSVAVSQTAFEDAPVQIEATASVSGYRDAQIVAELLDAGGKKVEEQTEKARRDDENLTFRFQIRPPVSGISFYRVRLLPKEEIIPGRDPAPEATLANNSRVLAVDRGHGPHRILYVGGRPNWEYKFLNRALAEDAEVQLVTLIRIAKREPKFEFRGRSGESSNPLFRGFDRKTEETERYDQPVLVRLNTRDASELRDGFPKAAEDLYEYEAVILDDMEAEFFSRDQMGLIQKFVSERGGGFLMLGGQESFHEGKYDRTPIADLLPIYIDRQAANQVVEEWQLDLTREGWLQPWIRLRSTETDERSRLESVPPFRVVNWVRDAKPGASVLATVSTRAGNAIPALIAHRYGHGRAAALTVGDFWQWGLKSEAASRDMAKAWRQMIRWLIADVPRRIDLQAEPVHDANQSIRLQLRVREKDFRPLENASAHVHVEAITSNMSAESGKTPALTSTNLSVRIQAEASPSEAGLYETVFVPRETGAYKAQAIVTDESGVEIGRVEAGWTADPAAEEFKSLKPNRELLQQIARRTGGELVDMDDLLDFTQALSKRPAPITETWSFPLWHTPLAFAFALACFVAEWGLRRWKGLA